MVRPFYLDDQSEPDENHFVWAYHVEIMNDGQEQVQLRTRYWRITDALGRVQDGFPSLLATPWLASSNSLQNS